MQAWMDLGKALWKDEERSFLVPRAPGVSGGCIALMANYQDVSAGTQKLFAAMTWPAWDPYTGWESSEVPMHSEFMRNFYSEHSGRTVLPSITAIIEPDKSRRDMLGRWKPDGSDDYTRTYQVIVGDLQLRAATALMEGRGADTLSEDDVVERLRRHLEEKKGLDPVQSAEICEGYSRGLRRVHSQFALAQAEGPLKALEPIAAREAPGVPEEVEPALESKAPESLFLISYSKNRKFARLHKAVQGCFWAASDLNDWERFIAVDSTMYNARCKFCWPRRTPGDTDSDSDSSKSSSGAGSEVA